MLTRRMITMHDDINERIDFLMNERHPDIVQEEEVAWNILMSANVVGDAYEEAYKRWSNATRTYYELCAPIRAEVEKEVF